jgi:hypothetical protein
MKTFINGIVMRQMERTEQAKRNWKVMPFIFAFIATRRRSRSRGS